MLLYVHRTRTTSSFTQLLSSVRGFEFCVTLCPQKPWAATSFTQLLGSEMRLGSMLLYVAGSTQTIKTIILGTGNPGRPPHLSHRSWALRCALFQCYFSSKKKRKKERKDKKKKKKKKKRQEKRQEKRKRKKKRERKKQKQNRSLLGTPQDGYLLFHCSWTPRRAFF